MEQNEHGTNKVKKILAVVLVVLACALVWFSVNRFTTCNSTSNKIEVLYEPAMTMATGSLGYTPQVKAQIKNKTNSTIKVEMTCSVYDRDGIVTVNLLSGYKTIGAGETTWLTAKTFTNFSMSEYFTQCANFGNVEYKFL